MRELFDRHKQKMDDAEDRRVWGAMFDETRRSRSFLGRHGRLIGGLATAGVAAAFVLVVVPDRDRTVQPAVPPAPEMSSNITVQVKEPGTRGAAVEPEGNEAAAPLLKPGPATGLADADDAPVFDRAEAVPSGAPPTEAGAVHPPAARQIEMPRLTPPESEAKVEEREAALSSEGKQARREPAAAKPAAPVTGFAEATRNALDASAETGTRAAPGPGAGEIRGRVTTVSGEPLRYANVILAGTRLGTMSDSLGYFVIPDVPPGRYAVNASYLGYEAAEIQVSVEPGSELELACNLAEAEPLTASVEVEEESKVTKEKKGEGRSLVDRIRSLSPLPAASKPEESPAGVASRAGSDEAVVLSSDAQTLSLNMPPGESRPGRYPISVGGTDPVNGEAFDAMFFEHYGVNPFIDTEDDRFSTFAVDVDNASYAMARSYLDRGVLPPKEAIRVEEFINSFDHGYAPPRDGLVADREWAPSEHGTFAIHLDAAPSPFGKNLVLLRVGLKGREVHVRDRKPATLTFVVDVSGSMQRENRLELVKRALHMLLDQMNGDDEVALVVYGSEARVICPPTSLRERGEIERAIDRLRAGGSTYAEAGLTEGYRIAEQAYRPGRINRVVLCSDGVANVGRTGAEDILGVIKSRTGKGIYLTAVGFGMGNYNDVLMEKLANQGDGNYYYVDSLDEARRVFVENLTGTLQTIARDTKIQVEFDPTAVQKYRLIGYENRDVADRDFRNDRVDAGEVGAGHEVTALFELRLEDRSRGDMATVRIRYEDPETGKVTEEARTIGARDVADRFERTDPTFRMDAAVAEFAEILRHSYWARDGKLSETLGVARDALRDLRDPGQLEEMVHLVETAWRLWPDDRPVTWNDHVRPRWEPEDD